VQEQFAEKFPETPVPHRNVVRRLIEKFRETGSVLDAERSETPSKLNGEKLVDLTPPDFCLWGAAKSAVYRHRPRMHELKTAITAYLRNISQADLQKVFANKIKRVQTCTDLL